MNAEQLTRQPAASVPAWCKWGFTAFMMVLLPVYWVNYGPTDFLFFCQVALLLTLVTVWTDSSLLISMAAVGVLIPQFLWVLDYGTELTGHRLTGMTHYMFDGRKTPFLRCLSLFHGWLPFLLLFLVKRLRYDRRTLVVWTVLAWALCLVCFFFMPGPDAVLPNPKTPRNINFVFGTSRSEAQHWMSPGLYRGVWMLFLLVVFHLPAHLLLSKWFPKTLTQRLAVIVAGSMAFAQTVPAATATNSGAEIITSAGFRLTGEGFITFTNAESARNHEKEIQAWAREGAKLTAEAASKLEAKWAANPKDEPTLVRLWSYRVACYGDESAATASAEKLGRLYACFIEMDPYSRVAMAESVSRLSPLATNPKCFEIVAQKWLSLAQQHRTDNYIIKQAGRFLMLFPRDESYVKQGEAILRQLLQRDPDSAWSYGDSCLDQARPCYDRPDGDVEMAAKALGALQTAEKLLLAEGQGQVQPDLHASLTKAAFWAGEYSLAEEYAAHWLEAARKRATDDATLPPKKRLAREMDLGDVIHQANSILGEIALSRDDTKRAGDYLIASGKVTKASPSLASYGPDLALMRDLLARKEKQPVLEFLDECTNFWTSSETEPAKWKEAIQSGNDPDFGSGFTTHFKRLK